MSTYVAACVALVPVPLIAMAYVPAGVPVDVLNVAADVPPVLTEVGLKVAVTPAGRLDADNVIGCAAPAVSVVETVAATEPPGMVTPGLGLTAMAKSLAGGGGTPSVPV